MSQDNHTKKIYFVRHGLSELNAAGRFAGHTETPLTSEGRLQSQHVGQQARKLGIDYILSSPLERTLETAQIIAEEIDYPFDQIHIDELLIERNFGELEAQPYVAGLDFSVVPNAESDEELKKRAKQALEFIDSVDAKAILIVGHGGLGRAMRFYIQPDVPFTKKLINARIYDWA